MTQSLGGIFPTLSPPKQDTKMNRPEISEAPLIGLFGSKAAYQVLMYLENYENGYASEIARTYGISLNQAQNQLRKFEQVGLFVSRPVGATRMFYFKKGPITKELRKFLRAMLNALPETTLRKYYRQRRRPRRYGKR